MRVNKIVIRHLWTYPRTEARVVHLSCTIQSHLSQHHRKVSLRVTEWKKTQVHRTAPQVQYDETSPDIRQADAT